MQGCCHVLPQPPCSKGTTTGTAESKGSPRSCLSSSDLMGHHSVDVPDPRGFQVSSAYNWYCQRLCEGLVCSKGWMQKGQGVIWIMCVRLLFRIQGCMSVVRLTIPVSCLKVTCRSYLMFMHCIFLYKVEIIQDTNYGQICATIRYLNRCFWQVWIRQE